MDKIKFIPARIQLNNLEPLNPINLPNANIPTALIKGINIIFKYIFILLINL